MPKAVPKLTCCKTALNKTGYSGLPLLPEPLRRLLPRVPLLLCGHGTPFLRSCWEVRRVRSCQSQLPGSPEARVAAEKSAFGQGCLRHRHRRLPVREGRIRPYQELPGGIRGGTARRRPANQVRHCGAGRKKNRMERFFILSEIFMFQPGCWGLK